MAKRTPLVSQQLENISREALGKYQDIIRQNVRRRHGVYALYRRGKLHYVGLASNLGSRLGHHLSDRHTDHPLWPLQRPAKEPLAMAGRFGNMKGHPGTGCP